MTETHTSHQPALRGAAAGCLVSLGGVLALLVGVYAGLTRLFESITPDERSSSFAIILMGTVAILFCGAGLALALSYGLGMARRRQDAPYQIQQPPVVEAPQLVAPRGMMQFGNTYAADGDRVQSDARAIIRQCKSTQPSRANVKRLCGITDNGRIENALDYLASRGVVTAGGQGKARMWVRTDEMEEEE